MHESYPMLLIKEKGSDLPVKTPDQRTMITILGLKTKYLPLLLLFQLATVAIRSQTNSVKKEITPKSYSSAVSVGICKAVPEFSRTHNFGVGFSYSWSKHRFGILEKKSSKSLGFMVDGGINHYFGRDETVSSFRYKYNSFSYIYTYAGLNYYISNQSNINLTLGPALGIEDGLTTFFWGVNLSGAYYIKEKIALIPGIQFMKDPESPDPLLSFSLKACFAFKLQKIALQKRAIK